MNGAGGGIRAETAVEPSLGHGPSSESADWAGQIPGFSSEFAVGLRRAPVNGCSRTRFVWLRKWFQ
jgi:hypothetical protein